MYTAIRGLTYHILTAERGAKSSKSHSGIFCATFYDLIDKAIELKLYTRKRSGQLGALVVQVQETLKSMEGDDDRIDKHQVEQKSATSF